MKFPTHTDFISSALSAVLWTPFPILIQLLDSGLTPSGRAGLLKRLPVEVLITYGVCLVFAFVMHYIFALRVAEAKGRSFWLLPFITLPTSAVMLCVLWWGFGIIDARSFTIDNFAQGVLSLAYCIVLVLSGVMGSLVWITYPLAIINQFLIRWMYNRSRRAA